MGRCSSCPHNCKAVDGEWKRQAGKPVLFVLGQNPGKMEANMGKLFVGPFGELVRAAINKVWSGSIYASNAVHCRPNEVKVGLVEVEACLSRLVQELSEVRPDMILALGNLAKSALVRVRDTTDLLEGVSIAHHSILAMGKGGGVRQGSWVQSCQAALVKAMTKTEELMLEPLVLDAEMPLLVGSDTEYFTRPVWRGADIWAVSDGDRVWIANQPDGSLRGRLYGHTVVMHHAVNEFIAMKGMGVTLPEDVHDTMVLAALDDEEGPRDLKVLSATKLNYVYDTPRVKEMTQDERTSIYCGHDSRATTRLFRDVYRPLADSSWLYNSLYRPIIPILADMSFRGLRVDKAKADDRMKTVSSLLEAVDEELLTYKNISWGSDEQVEQYMVEKGYPLEKRTAGDTRYSVDKESLLPLARKGIREAELVLDRRTLSKIKGTYLQKILDAPDGFIRTILNPVGAETGRISSGGEKQVGMTNLQNIPDEWNPAKKDYGLRDLFLPPEGMVWIEADCSQHEVRTASWLAERNLPADKRPMSTIVGGAIDFYRYIGQQYLGRDPTDHERDAFKTVVLAGQYLAKPGTLQRNMEMEGIFIEKDRIEDMMAFVDGQFPTIRWWHEQLFEEARSTGQITTPLGRRRRVFVGRGGSLTPATRRIIVNSPVQGTASDLVLRGMHRAHQARLHMLLTVHDSIDAAARPEDVKEVGQVLRESIMREPLLEDFPILMVKVKAGRSWGELQTLA